MKITDTFVRSAPKNCQASEYNLRMYAHTGSAKQTKFGKNINRRASKKASGRKTDIRIEKREFSVNKKNKKKERKKKKVAASV